MQNFHIKSIILGIGMGIVLTSIISIIYLAGVNPNTRMTKEEVIEQAKKYGMVENTQLINNKAENTEQNNDDVKKPDNSESGIKIEDTESPKPQPVKPAAVQEIKIVVNSGDTSEIVAEKLFKAGLISDKNVFIKELGNLGLTSNVEVGEFKIKTGTDIRTIIEKITKP